MSSPPAPDPAEAHRLALSQAIAGINAAHASTRALDAFPASTHVRGMVARYEEAARGVVATLERELAEARCAAGLRP